MNIADRKTKQSAPTGLRSPWHQPAFNIALEENLRTMAATDGHQGFFLCSRNSPAVIVGRNQDALAEVSPAARAQGLDVFRRTSGGGAVYHDEGNLNWSWIVPGGLDDRPRLLAPVLDVLRQLGIPADEGPRSGIYVNGRKIGGTATAAGRGVILFHGTLLICTNLARIHASLAAHAPAYASRTSGPLNGVASVPSELTTLASLQPGLDVATLESSLFTAIVQDGAPRPLDSAIDLDVVTCWAQDYSRESWILHRKPPAKPLRGTS